MVNVSLLWLLLVPLGLAVLHIITLRHNLKEAWVVVAMSTLFSVVLTAGVFALSASGQTWDTEILNGQVTGKTREQGHYLRSYQCRCRQTCSGTGQNRSCSTTCDTCYEDRYTVTWACQTTLGTFTIQHLDRSSRSVYNEPDPARWTAIWQGEPVSKTASYVNYVQAVPQSLFTPANEAVKARFANLIAPYPDQVYDFYRVDRFITRGLQVADAAKWNHEIGMLLRTLGPSKQVNLVVVVAPTSDPTFEFALRDAWANANKNDVVLIVGTTAYPKIEWVRVLTWSKAEIFKVELRDAVLALGEMKPETVLPVVAQQIQKNFVRREMADFEYLKSEIDPPMWVIVLLVVLNVLGAAGVQYGIHRVWFTPSLTIGRSSYPRLVPTKRRF
jgi:hypothetical protein